MLADDEVRLYGGATEAARLSSRGKVKEPQNPLSVVVTPEADQTDEEFEKLFQSAVAEFPAAEAAGFGGKSLPFHRLVVAVGKAGESFEEESGWLKELDSSSTAKVTLVLVYTPDVKAESIEQAAKACGKASGLESVVALPAGAGDRIPLPGLTTSGNTDMAVISALRYLLPSEVRVRASWAALGWKVAQMALTYGADELAGWTAAETRVYTGRVRAAARVEVDETEAGVAEAGCVRLAWNAECAGVNS